MDKEVCHILFPNYRHEPGIFDAFGCIQQGYHEWHIFKNEDGKMIQWKDDDTCKCGCWDTIETDPEVCIVYSECTSDAVKRQS